MSTAKKMIQVFDWTYMPENLRREDLPNFFDGVPCGSYHRWYPNAQKDYSNYPCLCKSPDEKKRIVTTMNKWLIENGMENDGKKYFYVLIYVNW